MIVLSESFWITENLRQHYDLADEIVIVEGAVPQAIRNNMATKEGLSNDDTRQKIVKFITEEDPAGKVRYVPLGGVMNRNRLRQACLNTCTKDWILIIDADEFYRKEDFQELKDGAAEANRIGLNMCYFSAINLADWEKGKLWHPMERFFRNDPELRYPDLDGGQYVCKAGGALWIIEDRHPIDIKCWHYFRIRESRERSIIKMKYYLERDDDEIVSDISEMPEHEQSMITKENLETYGFSYFAIDLQPEEIQKKYYEICSEREDQD